MQYCITHNTQCTIYKYILLYRIYIYIICIYQHIPHYMFRTSYDHILSPDITETHTLPGSHLICGAGAQSGAATTFPSAQSLAELHRREGCGCWGYLRVGLENYGSLWRFKPLAMVVFHRVLYGENM